MAKNADLSAAKTAKKDEFYTQLTDIEKEMRYYRKHFHGKTVLCNCDDPFESNFFKFFVLNFNRLGLKKLIATCYATSPIMGSQLLFYVGNDGQLSFSFDDASIHNDSTKRPYKAIVPTVYDTTGDGGVHMFDVAELFRTGENQLTELEGDGDYASPECIELLKEADIVVTNPPFSKFKEYVATLMEYSKKFIIIGNLNAVTYKEILPLLKDNKVWIGPSIRSGDRKFYVPDDYPLNAAGCGIDEEGRRFIRVKGVRWYTNLDIRQRHESIILVKHYNPELYPSYETFPAIDVSSVSDIPCDYDGIMGVPKNFIDVYNPEQFEILGYEREDENIKVGISNMPEEFLTKYRKQGGTGHYTKGMKMLCYYDNNGKAKIPFSRILIRNKHPEPPKGGHQ